MRFEEVLAILHEPQAAEYLRPHWEESVATLGEETPSFLQPEEYRVSRAWCGFGPEVDANLDRAARKIVAHRALTLLAWHCSRLLFEHPDYAGMARWPTLEAVLGELGGVFYLLVALGIVPRLRVVHQRMGVSESVTRETCTQISCIAGNYARMTGGRLGVTLNTLYWLRHYIAGRLFRLGRMEYMIQPFRGGVEVYRHRHTGRTLALAPDGVRYNGQGYVDGSGGITDHKHGWTATIVRNDDEVVGYPIAPHGMAVRRQVRLPLAQWECVLKKGDLSLDMHIPAGGNMTLERCGDSMRRAVPFFRQHFPDEPFRAIVSASWIFNTQLEQIKLSSDNLVRYQRELYLYPILSSGTDGLWFIFLRDDFNPATLPRDTSLRRGVADFLAAGNTWRCGAMFFLTDDLAKFGTQHYRREWEAARGEP